MTVADIRFSVYGASQFFPECVSLPETENRMPHTLNRHPVSAQPKPHYPEDVYLKLERNAEYKSE
ncbi:hypothetical protein GCM10027299_15680 [Larkinella ripae]